MSSDRQWMYARLENGWIRPEFLFGIEQFVDFAKMHPECMDGEKIKCPCNHRKCRNKNYLDENTVKVHLGTNGFVADYYCWYHHGETYVPQAMKQSTCQADSFVHCEESETVNAMQSMVYDVGGPSFNPIEMEETPNPTTQHLFDMLKAAQQEVWKENPYGHSQLSAVARMLNIKAEHHISERCYDEICKLMSELLPTDNLMTDSFYSTKKLVRGLGLPVQKIDCCEQNCMIYWGEDSHLTCCKICSCPRFKGQSHRSSKHKSHVSYKKMYYFPIAPRLQRLYASDATAKYMRWHAEQSSEEGAVMRHCSNSPAWKHFNQTHPSFAYESRNVRLGLCTDGFQPYGQTGQQYSSWPVILTPYNLPPWMCMKEEYLFLTVIIPGPNNPKSKLDVFLQPLIAELKELWDVGIETYDVSTKRNFQLRAALMWTISDFPAYSMLSGWGTAGKLACPYCMEDSDAFTLTKGGKTSWFDNHRKFLPDDHPWRRNKKWFRKGQSVQKSAPPIRTGMELINEIDYFGFKKVTEPGGEKINHTIQRVCGCGWKKRSIFWDLPYWKTNLIRHNLDVMHIEKNFFDNIFYTVMNVKGKTKDNAKSREDLKEFCNRPELHRDENANKYPKACYTLDKDGKEQLYKWIKKLKFPDGYVSNFARCVDLSGNKLYGLKSHDCHIFMQRLLPIAFHELLPANVWQALTELSIFFKDLTARVITEADMKRLEEEIPIVLCKLELIFPPSFFDSMEHLPVHLAYEARIAGPVQYRWMYPFERYLRKLKNNVRNKAKVEGSICNAYLVEEASSFCAHYFQPSVYTRHRKVPRNSHGCGFDLEEHPEMLSIFKCAGRSFGKAKFRRLNDMEYNAAHTYILLNCPEVKPYIQIFELELRQLRPNIEASQIDTELETVFALWFENYARLQSCSIHNQMIKDLAKGPLYRVKSFPGYYVNGFKFHTEEYGSNSRTMNGGVCIKGSSHSANELEYYGQLQEILELEYPALPIKRTVLFKCSWFDPTLNRGTRIHPQYKLVEVKRGRVFNRYEPFIFAVQAEQVYFASYPTLKRNATDWLAVCKIKARSIVEVPDSNACMPSNVMAFQEDVCDQHGINIETDDRHRSLNDVNGSFVDIDDTQIEKTIEPNLQIEDDDDEDIDVEQEFDDDDNDDDDDEDTNGEEKEDDDDDNDDDLQFDDNDGH